MENNVNKCDLQIPGSDPVAVDKYASIVIELDDDNEKAWYRKGQVNRKNNTVGIRILDSIGIQMVESSLIFKWSFTRTASE